MPVAIMIVWVVQLCTTADVFGFLPELVHVIYERKVVVRVWMVLIDPDAFLELVHSLVVLAYFEVRNS